MARSVRTVVFDAPGGPDVLHIAQMPIADLPANFVRVRVAAAGINRAELLQRAANYPVPPGASPHLGLEAAGTIIEVGKDVRKWKGGEKVMLLSNGGAYSEEVIVNEGHVLTVPGGWTDVDAGGFVETTLTAFLNIFQYGGLLDPRSGQIKHGSVLLHAGGSGVGTQGIKLCKSRGIKVFVTAGTDEKCKQCLEVGADYAINYKSQKFEDVVLQNTDQQGVDMILDNIGGPYLARDIACLARDGHIVFIGLMGGAQVDHLDLRQAFAKRAHIISSALRSRSDDFKTQLVADLQEHFGAQIQDGTLKPVIHNTYTFEQAADAHRLMESSDHFGKIVIVP